jgi:hypothetical protein
MNTQFTNEELKNLLALKALAPIIGDQATTLALLQHKIAQLLTAANTVNEYETKETMEETKEKK